MISLNSVAGRVVLFVLGHVVVLGLVIGLSMTAGQAVTERPTAAAIEDVTTTGSIRR